MDHDLTRAWLTIRAAATTTADRLRADVRGEGVISAAIAVLIMAFIGAGMWVAFNALFQSASETTVEQVERIGSG